LDQEKKCFSDVRSNKGALMMLPGSSEEDHNSSANLADFLAILNVALWGKQLIQLQGKRPLLPETKTSKPDTVPIYPISLLNSESHRR